jgi:hypothetical protein
VTKSKKLADFLSKQKRLVGAWYQRKVFYVCMEAEVLLPFFIFDGFIASIDPS